MPKRPTVADTVCNATDANTARSEQQTLLSTTENGLAALERDAQPGEEGRNKQNGKRKPV
jgi:hypothetical protein